MTGEEAFHAFLFGLQPHLQEHVGAHIQGDLDATIVMAQRLEVYCGSKKFKSQKKTGLVQVEGS